jgi:hypothetical protein
MCDHSATAERTSVETTTPRVAAATKPSATGESSTSAAVSSRKCYGTERNGCYTDYQSNYLLYFHAFKFDLALLASDSASAGFCGAT